MTRFLIRASVLTAVIAVWTACSSIDDGKVTSVINVTSERLVIIDYNGASIAIGYAIEGKGAGQVPSVAISDAESSIEDVTESSLAISIAGNLSENDRTITVTLSYPGAENAYVNIFQTANPYYKVDVNQAFEIVISGIKCNMAGISVRPERDTYYYVGMMTARMYRDFGSDDKVIEAAKENADAEIEYWNTMWGALGMTCSYKDVLYTGYYNASVTDLEPDTEYYVIACDMSLSGASSGKLSKELFRTAVIPASSDDFAISVTDGAVTVIPKDMAVTYVIDVVSVAYWNSMGGIPEDCAQDLLDWCDDEGYSIANWMYQGEATVNYAADSNFTGGDYMAYAFGYDRGKAEITTGISYMQFHYDAPSASSSVSKRLRQNQDR